MNDHDSQSTLEDARQILRQLVLEYRSIPLILVDRVQPQRCPIVISQFAVWLLDTSIDTMRFDWQRELHAKLRELHLQRINGESTELESWNSTHADSLAGSKLWPPEWLSASCFPSAPPIARTAAAIAIAQYRLQRETRKNTPRVNYRNVQAETLRCLLSSHTRITEVAALQSISATEMGPHDNLAVPVLIDSAGVPMNR